MGQKIQTKTSKNYLYSLVNNNLLCYTKCNNEYSYDLGESLNMDYLYDSFVEVIKKLDAYISPSLLLIGSVGLLLLVFISTLIRTSFSYELKLLRVVNRLNRYFMHEPYVNDENLIRFNRKMKKVPRNLRYAWQEFMLNRDKAPSEYMNTTTCIDQPSKASNYQNAANALGTFTIIIALLTYILTIVINADLQSTNPAEYFLTFFLVPVVVAVLGYLFVLFMRARYTSVVADLYYVFHEFERNINKACTTLPQFIDYEVLFTKKEIREGIPVLQEYLEKRALQEKIEQEEAQLNSLEYEQFDFEEIGVENSLLLDRALLESEKYFKVKTDLSAKIKAKETEMLNYQKGFDEVTKDYERKAQVLRETLKQLTEQINNTTIKIEANYMKKRYNEEQQRLQQLEKEYELSTNRFQKQQAELEEEINSYKEEVARRKQQMQEAMMAEGRTYAKKVYSVITADVQEQSRPYLEQMEVTKAELEQAVNTLKHELQFKNTELATLNAKLEKATQEYQVKLVGLEHLKELKDYLTSAEYKQKLLNAEDLESGKDVPLKTVEKLEKVTKELEVKEKELKVALDEKVSLERQVKELTSKNVTLEKQVEKLSKKQKDVAPVKEEPMEEPAIEIVEQPKETVQPQDEPKEEEKDDKPKFSLFGKFKKKEAKPEQPEMTEPVAPKPVEEVLMEEPMVEAIDETLLSQLVEEPVKPQPKEVVAEKPQPKPEIVEQPKPVEEPKEEPKQEPVEQPKAEPKPNRFAKLEERLNAKPVKQTETIVEQPVEEVKPEVVAPKPEPKQEEKPAKPEPKQKVEKVEPKEKPVKAKKVEEVEEGVKSEPVKVERIIANKPRLGKQEIDELNAIKERIQAESVNLQKQKNEYDNTIASAIDSIETVPANEGGKPKNKIGSSLSSLLQNVEKIEKKNNKK